MKKFKVNDFIELRLEQDKTEIYIAGEHFLQCKFLFLNLPVESISSYDEIESIDEAAEKFDNSLELGQEIKNSSNSKTNELIAPEEQFWGHCSNLQVWVENNYDTQLLHRNLAFPLLKELTEIDNPDPDAQKAFKNEIAKRINSGYAPVIIYLLIEGYLNYFNEEEVKVLIEQAEEKELENLDVFICPYRHTFGIYDGFSKKELVFMIEHPALRVLDNAIKLGDYNDVDVWLQEILYKLERLDQNYLEKLLLKKLRNCNLTQFLKMKELDILEYVKPEKFLELLLSKNSNVLNLFKKANENKEFDIYYGEFCSEFIHIRYKNLKIKLLKLLKEGEYSDFKIFFILDLFNWLNETETNDLIQNSHYLENLMKFIQEINIEENESLIILFIECLFNITSSLFEIDKDIIIKVYNCLSRQKQELFLDKINHKLVRYGNKYESLRELPFLL